MAIGISGACRGSELVDMKLQDIKQEGQMLVINIPKTKTDKARSFTVSPSLTEIVNKYRALRPTKATTDRFFLNYQNENCTVQPMGKNKIAGIPKLTATWLNLPDVKDYTGHAYRRTGATLLAESGGTMFDLKFLGGWVSDRVAAGYVENSIANKRKIQQLVMSNINIGATSIDEPSSSHRNPANQAQKNVEKSSSPVAKRIRVESPKKIFQFNNGSVTIVHKD